MTVYCERTGQTFATETQAATLTTNCHGAVFVPVVQLTPIMYQNSDGSMGRDLRERDAAGNLNPSPTQGSQFWMDSGYSGAEPTLAVKAKLSTADYARDWLGEYARTLEDVVNPNITTIQKYPITENTAQIWKVVPQLKPSAGVEYNTPSSSPGSTNEPPTATLTTTQPTIGTVGTPTSVSSTVSGVAEAATSVLGQYGAYILAGVAVLIVLFFVGTGMTRGVRG